MTTSATVVASAHATAEQPRLVLGGAPTVVHLERDAPARCIRRGASERLEEPGVQVRDGWDVVEHGRVRGDGAVIAERTLAIVRSIVRAHDGTLTLASREGGGLRVEVRLPDAPRSGGGSVPTR